MTDPKGRVVYPVILKHKGLETMDEILTVEEMAQYLKVSRSTVWRWCNEGKVSAFKVGRGWRVHRSQLEKIMGQKIGKVAEPKRNANGRL